MCLWPTSEVSLAYLVCASLMYLVCAPGLCQAVADAVSNEDHLRRALASTREEAEGVAAAVGLAPIPPGDLASPAGSIQSAFAPMSAEASLVSVAETKAPYIHPLDVL